MNRMNRLSPVLMVLVAATFATGCADRFVLNQVAVSAQNDLDGMSSNWLSDRSQSGANGAFSQYTNTSYLVSDVHYSMASPVSAVPATTAETTAVAVNTNGRFIDYLDVMGSLKSKDRPSVLKVLEFGTGGALASTENSLVTDSWANQLADSRGTRELSSRGFDSIKDVGNDSILGWGRWTDARFISAGDVQPGCCSENKSAHYVFGAATPNANIPNTGLVATFNLLAATAPTISDGSSVPGTLNSGTVAVSLNGATVNTRMGVNLAGTLGGLPFTVQSPGTTVTPTIPYDPATRSFTMTNSNVDGSSVSGFLAGPNASHVGLTYSTPRQVGGNTLQIQGAAAFNR